MRTLRNPLIRRPLHVDDHRDAAERVTEHQRRNVRSQLRVEERARVVLARALAAPLREVHKRIPGVAREHAKDGQQRDEGKQNDGLSVRTLTARFSTDIDVLTMRDMA